MTRRRLVGWADIRSVLAAVSGFAVLALSAGHSAAHGADIELGRYLSSECMTCHSAAQSHSQIPNIFGIAEDTFEQVVKAYREKKLNNQVMQTVSARLNDEEIAALAAYFAQTKRPN